MVDTYTVFHTNMTKCAAGGVSDLRGASMDKECKTLSDYNRGPNDPFRSEKASSRPADAGNSFLTEDPAQLGAQMQQGGVPLPENADFLSQGDNAPTRIGRPMVPPQMVTRHTSIEQPAPEAKAETSEPAGDAAPVRRR
ncbi:MAG: hypothetical protein IKU70_02685, partial [Clostridia bacterium]|nr:hypothetical protein [Clostridia bacterium]